MMCLSSLKIKMIVLAAWAMETGSSPGSDNLMKGAYILKYKPLSPGQCDWLHSTFLCLFTACSLNLTNTLAVEEQVIKRCLWLTKQGDTELVFNSFFYLFQVVECLPVHWFSGLKGQQTLPQLEPFCRFLTHMANSLHRNSLGGSDVERRTAK